MGHYFEEFELGREFVTAERQVTEADVRAFAELSGDRNPIHLDAGGGRRRRGSASRWRTGRSASRSPRAWPISWASPAARWSPWWGSPGDSAAPILYGDRVRLHLRVSARRASGNPSRGVVTLAAELRNQRDEVTQEGEFVELITPKARHRRSHHEAGHLRESSRWRGRPQPAAAQTPSGWRAHDLTRPRPPVVTPGMPAAAGAAALGRDRPLRRHGARRPGGTVTGAPPGGWCANGAMEAVPGAGYVYTRQTFGDVQLHIEWAAPTPPKDTGQGRGNSGVFLMEEYELQVLGLLAQRHLCRRPGRRGVRAIPAPGQCRAAAGRVAVL